MSICKIDNKNINLCFKVIQVWKFHFWVNYPWNYHQRLFSLTINQIKLDLLQDQTWWCLLPHHSPPHPPPVKWCRWDELAPHEAGTGCMPHASCCTAHVPAEIWKIFVNGHCLNVVWCPEEEMYEHFSETEASFLPVWQWQRIWALGAFRHRWRHRSWCWPPCKSARDHRRNSGGPWLACCLWMEQPAEDETCGNDSIMTSLIALTVVGQLVDHHDPSHCVNCEVRHSLIGLIVSQSSDAAPQCQQRGVDVVCLFHSLAVLLGFTALRPRQITHREPAGRSRSF